MRMSLIPGWMSRAACIGCDPEIFFSLHRPGGTARARQICRSCSVRNECLEYALAAGERFGIWGGATFEQRRTMLCRDTQMWRRWTYWKGVKIVNTDETLIEIRGLARLLYEHWDSIRILRPDELAAKAFRLAQLINALDESLCDAGELPAAWRASRRPAST
ncbi:WhiB family transcriptional regulator [Actinomadura barringtoniae]|uniref:Transcriptional regulator WhiB n=1 Tax=Actinomadura barringtoniae TaxID=1427535 RepID=A0A939T4V4_9ACTN|nr:WhiB family transcriptional regulator [Actinomadura barringtoniae]MBO2448734.1 WhiB family transcriptional regulator [Actinomadura barringtoniae]